MDETTKALNNEEAAARLGVSKNTLKLWRHQGKGPPFTKNNPDSPQSGVTYDPACGFRGEAAHHSEEFPPGIPN